jgi:hypothetical protein
MERSREAEPRLQELLDRGVFLPERFTLSECARRRYFVATNNEDFVASRGSDCVESSLAKINDDQIVAVATVYGSVAFPKRLEAYLYARQRAFGTRSLILLG